MKSRTPTPTARESWEGDSTDVAFIAGHRYGAVIVPRVTPPNAPRRPAHTLSPADRRALLAILLSVSLGSLNTSIANTALPTIAAELQTTPAASIWIINAYQMAIVATLLPFAALGNLWGPRKVFLGGLAFFTVSSLGATWRSHDSCTDGRDGTL